MNAVVLRGLLAGLALFCSLTACAARASPLSQDELQDIVLDFSVKALHALIDPESASLFSEPTIAVDCVSDAAHRDCCVATGSMEVDAPIRDFSDKIREDLRKQIDTELSTFELFRGREPGLPRDMDWLIQLNGRVTEKTLREWFDQNPKLEAIFQPLVLTPEACRQILNDEIERSFPGAVPVYVQGRVSLAPWPSLIGTKPLLFPACHWAPAEPFDPLVCDP